MHSIKQFCDKIDSIKSMADDIRKPPPSDPKKKNKKRKSKKRNF